MRLTKNIFLSVPYFLMAIIMYFWLIPFAYTQYDGLVRTTGQIVGFDKNFSNYSIGINARTTNNSREKILVKYTVDGKEYGNTESPESINTVSIYNTRKVGDSIDIYYDNKFPDQYIIASDYNPNVGIFAYLICGLSILVGFSRLFKK